VRQMRGSKGRLWSQGEGSAHILANINRVIFEPHSGHARPTAHSDSRENATSLVLLPILPWPSGRDRLLNEGGIRRSFNEPAKRIDRRYERGDNGRLRTMIALTLEGAHVRASRHAPW
jgi:hypothetical protein